MFGLGTPELLIILAILLLLFGGKKLPDLARNIGTSVKELRKGFDGSTDDKPNDKKEDKKEDKKADTPTYR